LQNKKIYFILGFMPKGIRSKDQRTITISCRKSLVAEIDELAAAENRSRSNWVVRELQKLVDALKPGKIAILPRAAEHPGPYKSRSKKPSNSKSP
jgi:hypothetical protein